MYSKSPGVHAPSARGTVKVLPDRVDVSIRVKVEEPDAARAPRSLEAALQRVAKLVGSAVVTPVSYRSSNEKLASKSLFGGGSRTAAQAVCRVELPLDPEDGFLARAIALDSLRDSLERASSDDVTITVGDSRYTVSDPEQHRAAATKALHDQLREAASACGMTLDRLELSTALDVGIAGPCEAYVSVSGTAHFASV